MPRLSATSSAIMQFDTLPWNSFGISVDVDNAFAFR
jgi:hypothetical protein